MKKRYLLFAALWLAGPALAQQPAALLADADPWPSPLAAALAQARPLTLDVAAARAVLATAPPESQLTAAPLVLALPLPDGRQARFAVRETAVMEPALASRFPAISTYAGYGLDDATATVRLDLTPAGFHAQILSATSGTVYIDPAQRGDNRHYLSFFSRDIRRGEVPACNFRLTKADRAAATARRASWGIGTGGPAATAGGSRLRTYRLAVAATGEYSAFHGGTVPLVQAAIVTSVNRVVGVYEKELAVRMILVANNDQLIYLNAATDPYTNNDGGDMLDENQPNVDTVIGSANYDIGHVFSTGGGGVAYYACVCTANKAKGVTGSGSPVGDSFDIDYVAHEMGHQFSGSHPFNGSSGACTSNRSAEAAWEPGSGTTIMAYAGICSPEDIQQHSDAFFHVGNYEEMRPFIVATPCAAVAATANTPPVVSGPPGGLLLPFGTPFKLTATAADAEGDSLTYSWEELDLGSQGSPTSPQVAQDNVPLFRAFAPQRSATRYFPQLADLVNNTSTIGERLPTVDRALTFKCAARDQHRGPAGTIGGVTSSDSVKLRVTRAAGPFRVSYPNIALAWAGNSTQTVTWDVAGTTANGVNCSAVNIRLSTDGGYTYPTALAMGVPNTGTATVLVPSVATSTARVMVEAVGNYFFDISNTNFTISSPSVCAPPTGLAISNITNTSARLSFVPSASGVQYLVTTTPVTTSQTVSASPVLLTGLQPGTAYTVSVVTDCSGSVSVAVPVAFVTTAPPLCSPPTELAVSNVTTTTARVSFTPAAPASSYTVSTVPASSSQTVTASPVTLSGLQPDTHYLVYVVSSCGAGATSPAAIETFRTVPLPPANDLCANALPLVCGLRVTGNTISATATGDPTTFCDTAVDGGGVFYTLAGTGAAVTLSTCDPATDYDTKLFVYQGPCGGPYICVAGNDDTNATGSCGLPSTLTFASTAGRNYLVFVSGFNGDTGHFGLLATCATPTATARAAETAFRVWPNPAGAHASLRVEVAAPAATITLCNVLGQRLLQKHFTGSATDLPTAGLVAGIYLLTVQAAGQAPAVQRVVVE